MPIVIWSHFIPDHFGGEMQDKLKKVAQLYWTEQAAKEVLAEKKSAEAAICIQRIREERKALIKTLPLVGIKGGKEPLNFKHRKGETDDTTD